MITPEGFLKLTLQTSEEYQEIINGMAKAFNMYEKITIFSLYFDYIPFKLIDLPNESYVNPATVPNIQNRYKEKITKQCPWSLKDIGSNCTKLSSYFEKSI